MYISKIINCFKYNSEYLSSAIYICVQYFALEIV